MNTKAHCPNRNHGKSNAEIRHCPTCGLLLNDKIQVTCNDEFHASQRKNRNGFCYKCGKKL